MTLSLKEILSQAAAIDIETTINATNPNHFGATPFDPANSIVMVGWNYLDNLKSTNVQIINGGSGRFVASRLSAIRTNFESHARLLVGHNIPFDLHHLLASATSEEFHEIIADMYIWDTMIAEYYLTRQECKSISLEDLAARYSIPFTKDVTVSESFKLGIGADKIDPKVLETYLKGDVQTTTKVFLAQQQRALEIGGPEYVEYLIALMGARLTTMLMERNGCHINDVTFTIDKTNIEHQVKAAGLALESILEDEFGPHFDGVIAINSPKQVHTYLFGGDIKLVEQVDVGEVYKGGAKKGQPKLKTVRTTRTLTSLISPNFEGKKFAAMNSVDSKVLNDILLQCKMASHTKAFIERLLLLRTLTKDLSTYETYGKQFYPSPLPHLVMLHPNFNHALTNTKRPSCSQPNLQNVSNKDMDIDVS